MILANGLKQDLSRQGLGSVAGTMPLGAAAAALAGCPSVAFATINDSRWRTDSPVDKVAGVVLPALARQVDFLVQVLPRLVDDPQLEPWAWGNDAFGVLAGEVVHYGPRSYLPDQPTGGALVRVRLRQPTLMGVRSDYWAVADDSGRFVVPGVESGIIYTQPVRVGAYGIDRASGAVVAAPDWGISGQRRLPGRVLQVLMDDLEEEVQVVTTLVAGLTLFEPFDPRNLLSLESVEVIDAAQGAEPVRFGAVLPLSAPEVELFSYKNRLGSWIGPAAVLFAQPGSRIKAIMSTGRFGLGRRLLLLNGDSTAPEGRGFLVEGETLLTGTAYQIARDMAALNGERINNLENHGVRNGRLAAFQSKAQTLLAEAAAARAGNRHHFFLDRARMAWAYGAAAYREVERTRGGVVQGALFLLAMLLPFAHFAERLFCGFTQLRRQVLGYFVFFAAGFLALNYLHPAFELAISPAVILLGFVILTLSILVSWIGIGRLNRELQGLVQGRRSHRDVQRSSTLLAAVAVGLAHLKRRPLRTGLTCITLVLLTFSVLSFTSMRAALRTNWIATGQKASYEGALVRLPGWQTMEMGAYRLLVARYGAGCAPRAWLGVGSLAAPLRLEREGDRGTSVGIMGLTGLSPQEGQVTKPQQGLVAGRWLAAGEEDGCLLPKGVADSLKIGPEALGKARIRLFGESFRVVGLFGDSGIAAVDLNGAPLTPLDPESQQPSEAAAGPVSGERTPVYTHLSGAVTAVFPFEAVMRWEGARLVSVAVPMADSARDLAELAEVVDLNLFAGRGGQRYLVNTVGVTSVAGWSDLLVPLGIAALIVLNTMLGAVYERSREIGTFNAVGLAPTHVSLLFIGEACAFGVIGAVFGYLLGQAAAQGAAHWGWLAGLELNYSSLSAVTTMGVVIGVVLLSALYPARLAARICTPGIERRWRLPPPEGDQLRLRLPFVLAYRDALGMAAFQAEFWGAHREQSIGAGFYVEALAVEATPAGMRLEARVWLAPFDRGVVQDVRLEMAADPGERYCTIDLVLKLAEGDFETWRRVSRTFVDDLRKQFLLWRTLSDQERLLYINEMEQWGQDAAGGQEGMRGKTIEAEAKSSPEQEA